MSPYLRISSAEFEDGLRRSAAVTEEQVDAYLAGNRKMCSRCQRELPPTSFHRNGLGRPAVGAGLSSQCKDCRRGQNYQTEPAPMEEQRFEAHVRLMGEVPILAADAPTNSKPAKELPQ